MQLNIFTRAKRNCTHGKNPLHPQKPKVQLTCIIISDDSLDKTSYHGSPVVCKGNRDEFRVVHNFSHLGGGAMSLGEVMNMAACPEVVYTRGVWGHSPSGNFDDFRCSEVHSGAF